MQQQCNEIDSVCFPRVYILVLLPAVDMERENQNHGGLYVTIYVAPGLRRTEQQQQKPW